MSDKRIIYMVGLPCSGKSTYIEENFNLDEVVVISNDIIIEEIAKEKNITYNEAYKLKDSFNKVKKETSKRFVKAVSDNVKTIIIDNTNLYSLPRMKYKDINYSREAIVFKPNMDLIHKRNKERAKEGKTILSSVLDIMLNKFEQITDDENFDKITTIS